MAEIRVPNVRRGDCAIIQRNDGKPTRIDIDNGHKLDDESTERIEPGYAPQDLLTEKDQKSCFV